MKIKSVLPLIIICVLLLTIPLLYGWNAATKVEIIIGSFLGDEQRNYYGNRAPAKLDVIWKTFLGKGKTIISTKIGEKEWAGSGWTGQPLLVREDGRLILFQGAFDHKLKKLDAASGKIIWQYSFDDVIKGTGSIWLNGDSDSPAERFLILQGSRRGLDKNLYSRIVPSFRAISGFSGEEIWRLNVGQTPSYSRDVDGSALVLGDTAYIALENSVFIKFNPDRRQARIQDGILQPQVFQQVNLFSKRDIQDHGGNLVVESSPALLGDRIYITAGSGHVFGYNLKKQMIDWDFYIGSDMDGSPVVTSDSCLIVTVEKQYIPGKGGVFKLDPRKSPEKAVIWFMPTEDDSVENWAGGVIGSVGINDRTKSNEDRWLCAFVAIDGYLYVVDHRKIDNREPDTLGPDNRIMYPQPELVFRKKIGPSIATPIIVGNKLVVPGYKGLFLFEFNTKGDFRLLDKHLNGSFESTPIAYDQKIYVGSRDGYLYCLGER